MVWVLLISLNVPIEHEPVRIETDHEVHCNSIEQNYKTIDGLTITTCVEE